MADCDLATRLAQGATYVPAPTISIQIASLSFDARPDQKRKHLV